MVVGIVMLGVVFSIICVLLFMVSLFICEVGKKKVIYMLVKLIKLSIWLLVFIILLGCIIWYWIWLLWGVFKIMLFIFDLICVMVVLVVFIVVRVE